MKGTVSSGLVRTVRNLVFFALCVLVSFVFTVDSVAASTEINESAQSSTHSSVHIGAALQLNSPMGLMIDSCLSIALSDFYSVHSSYKTRLFLHVKNADKELEVASAALELLKNGEVQAFLGPQWSTEAAFSVELGARAHVPVISFTAKNRAFSYTQSPYFVRTIPDDIYQVKGLAAICQGFAWHEVVIVYEDTEYGNAFISKLKKEFQEVDIRIAYVSALSTSSQDVYISKELNKLMTMQTRVFLVHMSISLGYRLFDLARNAGMMTEGYAWLITDSLSNFLSSMDSASMEGVLGIRPHVPKSQRLEDFKESWKRNILMIKPESTIMELNTYGLWAYDTVWALAMAVEKVMHINSDFLHLSKGENKSDLASLVVSKFGQRILAELLLTKFTGLSGEFQLDDGHLKPSAFEIFNVIGTGDRTVGYWTPDRGILRSLSSTCDPTYSTSTKELKAIMWPGDTLIPPRGWAIPSTGKLKIGVPKKEGFTEFVNIQIDPLTNHSYVSGFSIDVFLASLQLLPFKLEFEFMPYENATRHRNGSYNDMLHKILDQTFDFVVGDVTILSNRAAYVDFTLPYTESGIVMVVKNNQSTDMWIFLKPLRWDLWLIIVLACIFIGAVIRILEHQMNNSNAGSLVTHGQQLGLFFLFPIAVLAFPERNMVGNNWSRFVLVVWLFVAYILMQSYTAKLSSIFTVDQLQFVFSEDHYVGHQQGSFVRDFLIDELHFNETKLKKYSKVEEFHDAMSRGSRKGGIDIIFGEIPYMKLLLKRYGSKYRIVQGRTYKTHGLGFAFPLGSPLVSYFSRAILNVTQGAMMTIIEQKNFGPGYPYEQDSINQDSPSLTSYNFGGVFIIMCSATIVAVFCSMTTVGRKLTASASSYGHRLRNSIFSTFSGIESRFNSISKRDVTGESSSEEAVESEDNNRNMSTGHGGIQPEDGTADVSSKQGEVHESNRRNINAVSAGPSEADQVSELESVDASAGPTGICIYESESKSCANVSAKQIK